MPIQHHLRLYRLIGGQLQSFAAHQQKRTVEHQRRLESRLPCRPLQRDAVPGAVFQHKMHTVVGGQPHGRDRPSLGALHPIRQGQAPCNNRPGAAQIRLIHTPLVIEHQRRLNVRMSQRQQIDRQRRRRFERWAARHRTQQLQHPTGAVLIAAAQHAIMEHARPASCIEAQHGMLGQVVDTDGDLLAAGTPAMWTRLHIHRPIGLPPEHSDIYVRTASGG
ncbi:hypothetical protein [Xanthomonas cucurbitae]|nr:hypothetical protein [Xanthomonas cucurbitae]